MRRILPYIIILGALFAGSCSQNEPVTPGPVPTPGPDEMMTVNLEVSVPETPVSRGATDIIDGGADVNADWGVFDVRYIMEVWSRTSPQVCLVRKEIYRNSLPTGSDPDPVPIAFEVTLPMSPTYDFLFWCDLIPYQSYGEGITNTDYHYNTSTSYGLRNVWIIDEAGGKRYTCNTPSRDAYDFRLLGKTLAQAKATTIALKRPFAKVAFQAQNLTGEVSSSHKVNVIYKSGIPQFYDVASETTGALFTPQFEVDAYDDYNATAKTQTLMTDYIFVKGDILGESSSISVYATGIVGGYRKGRLGTVQIAENKVSRINATLKSPYGPGEIYNANGLQGVICWTDMLGTEALLLSQQQSSQTTYADVTGTWLPSLGSSRWEIPTADDIRNMFANDRGMGDWWVKDIKNVDETLSGIPVLNQALLYSAPWYDPNPMTGVDLRLDGFFYWTSTPVSAGVSNRLYKFDSTAPYPMIFSNGEADEGLGNANFARAICRLNMGSDANR